MAESNSKTYVLAVIVIAAFVIWWYIPWAEPQKLEETFLRDLPTGPPPPSRTEQSDRSWKDLNIIDIHGHIGAYSGYDLSTETLLANIDRWGMKMVLISNIDGASMPGITRDLSEREANSATEDVIGENPKVLRGLLWTRPGLGNPANIEAFLKPQTEPDAVRVFVGMKFHPEMNQFAADDAVIDPYLALCAKYELPAVFHSGAPGSDSDPAKIYAAAKRHPTVPVILYHMGFGGHHDHAIAIAKQAKDAHDADLYLETAQADPDAVMKAIETLGTDRVLFGTDASYYGREHYEHYDELIERLKADLSDEGFNNVVRGNAQRLFGLN